VRRRQAKPSGDFAPRGTTKRKAAEEHRGVQGKAAVQLSCSEPLGRREQKIVI